MIFNLLIQLLILNQDMKNQEQSEKNAPKKDPIRSEIPDKLVEKYNGQGFSNNVLYDEKEKTYYLPARVRLKFKSFKNIKMDQLRAEMDATLIISIFYENLPVYLIKQLQQNVVVNFNIDNPYRLSQGYKREVTVEQKKKQITFYYRGTFQMIITGDVFKSPFEIISLVLTVNLLKIVVHQNVEGEFKYQPKCTLKFNMMDCNSLNTKIEFTDSGKFGTFDLAENLRNVTYTNFITPDVVQDVNKDALAGYYQLSQTVKKITKDILILGNSQINQKADPKLKLQSVQYAHFNLPVYRFPGQTITTIFIPLILLSIINLFIFSEDASLSESIGSIAAVMVGFSALIPMIRGQIPPTHCITFIEYLVLGQLFSSLLCVFYSWYVNKEKDEYYCQWIPTLLWIVSIIILGISIISLIYLYVQGRRRYKQINAITDVKDKQSRVPREKWYHQKCDMLFYQAMKNKQIVVLSKYSQENLSEKKMVQESDPSKDKFEKKNQ